MFVRGKFRHSSNTWLPSPRRMHRGAGSALNCTKKIFGGENFDAKPKNEKFPHEIVPARPPPPAAGRPWEPPAPSNRKTDSNGRPLQWQTDANGRPLQTQTDANGRIAASKRTQGPRMARLMPQHTRVEQVHTPVCSEYLVTATPAPIQPGASQLNTTSSSPLVMTVTRSSGPGRAAAPLSLTGNCAAAGGGGALGTHEALGPRDPWRSWGETSRTRSPAPSRMGQKPTRCAVPRAMGPWMWMRAISRAV